MKLRYSVPFRFEEANYEVRVYSDGWNFTVQAYCGGQPANGYSHHVDLPTAFDLNAIRGLDVIEDLIRTARAEVETKAWQKYVVAYLAEQKTSERDSVACRKCTSRSVESSMVDGRRMFECLNCDNVWYEPRKSGGGVEVVLDEITDDVARKGSHEAFTVILLNVAFRENSSGGLSFWDQLENWSKRNRLDYDTTHKRDDRGKMQDAIRFTRRPRTLRK
ncbi:MAG: hypothetical protein INR62_03480 [Rhodospirillales bacterium]|nr:hypothetical protein [Acetobacter sp.]